MTKQTKHRFAVAYFAFGSILLTALILMCISGGVFTYVGISVAVILSILVSKCSLVRLLVSVWAELGLKFINQILTKTLT